MDGAAEEEKEKLKIKNAVKENFRSLRRMQNRARQKRRTIVSQPQETRISEEDWGPSESTSPHEEVNGNLFVPEVDDADSVPAPSNQESHFAINNSQPIQTTSTQQERRQMPWIDSHDASLLMHYLDQVFSWQFPYHSYASRSGNRGWLLLLLIQQGPLYHAILSLSSLHQSALLGREEEYCQQSIAFDRHSRALRELCAFMSCKEDKLFNDPARMTEFLSSSIMLITFEVRIVSISRSIAAKFTQVFRGGEHDWQLHLNAVTSTLSQLPPETALMSQDPRDDPQLDQMHEYLKFSENKDRYGLQFLITATLWFDILSCVSTGKVPALPYNQWLRIPELDTAGIMGCQNWIMSLIGDLACLQQWKDNSIKSGLLSTRELAVKGQQIENALEDGLTHLDLNKKVCLVPLL